MRGSGGAPRRRANTSVARARTEPRTNRREHVHPEPTDRANPRAGRPSVHPCYASSGVRRSLLSALWFAPLGLLYACVGSDPDVVVGSPDASLDGAAPSDGATSVEDAGNGGDTDGPAEPCTPDLFCQPANECKKGKTACGATAECVEIGNVDYGLACKNGGPMICKAGACEDTNWALWPMPSWADAPVPPIPTYSFESSSAGETSIDSVTGLLWTRAGPSAQTWAQAKAHCDDLAKFGFSDWRLPTAIELVSIGDVSQASGFAAKFGAVTGGMWSSTPVAGTAGNHWSVSSLRVTSSADSATFDVRCVR